MHYQGYLVVTVSRDKKNLTTIVIGRELRERWRALARIRVTNGVECIPTLYTHTPIKEMNLGQPFF